MISEEHNFIFLHVPKTGGTSIERALASHYDIYRFDYDFWHEESKHWSVHFTLQEMIKYKQIKKPIDEYFVFSVVRNPWDRIVSAARWRQMDLEEFYFRTKSRPLKRLDHDRHKLAQTNFMKINQNIHVDFIGRFESLKNDWLKICDKLNIKIELPHINKSEHNSYQDYYSPKMRDIIYKDYKEEIKLFKYEF
jgi:hypothetical protein